MDHGKLHGQRRMNENTSKSEEAKVGLGNEVIGIISNREKDRVKNTGISNDF